MIFRKYSCILQHDASDCAAATIATVLSFYKQERSIMKIREIIGTDLYGTSVKGIVEGLEKLHFQVKAVRVAYEDIVAGITFPAIAQVKTKPEDFKDIYEGVLVMMVPTSLFEKTKFIGIAMYFGSGHGLIAAAGSLVLAKKLIAIAGNFSMLLGKAVSLLINWALWTVGKIMIAIGTAAIIGRGVKFGFSLWPWDAGVTISLR